MDGMLRVSAGIDALNRWIGRTTMWLILAMVLVSSGNALVRKLFDVSSNLWLELQWQMFAVVFMMCAAYTLLVNEHIRIDILNSRFSKGVRNWIEIIGHCLFLMPFALLMVYDGWPFFTRSYAIGEQSMNSGGLAQWPAKLLVPLGFFFLALQGVSEIIKRVAIMRGLIPDPSEGKGGHHGHVQDEQAL